jgi:anti-sigma regulatory factor (Ser/Thr protein kinase)
MTLPATLRYREVAIHTVTAACHLVGGARQRSDGSPGELDLGRAFDAEFISAFSEIFNNIAIHSYESKDDGELTLELTPADDHLQLTIRESGLAFDIDAVPTPELDALPEGGMGIHIARACLSELNYTPGPPNVWRLTKYLPTQQSE